MTYDPIAKIYKTVCNGNVQESNINAVNRDCAYCYVNGEKYYGSG